MFNTAELHRTVKIRNLYDRENRIVPQAKSSSRWSILAWSNFGAGTARVIELLQTTTTT